MSGGKIWVMLPALASAGLLSLGLWAGQPQPPVTGPTPPVATGPRAPAGMTVQFQAGSRPDAAMSPLPARVTGRAARDGDGYLHQWPGFHATARFSGTAVALAIDDSVNRYRVTLDETQIVLTRVGAGMLRIGGLAPGRHQIRLEKLSESAQIARFDGFFLPAGADPLPPPDRAPLIEFVGDSDTVGYGNTAPGRDCTPEQQYLATDTSMAYGPMAARALDADYRIVAASGIGLVRNLGGDHGPAMQDLYDRTIPSRPGTAPQQPADVIVIAVGSNDFAERPDLKEGHQNLMRQQRIFASRLLRFMRARRAEAPSARIVLLVFGEYGRNLVEAHEEARDAFAADGDRADLLILPELARTACHWHPSLNDHQIIAGMLTDLLQSPRPASEPGEDRDGDFPPS
ncbi:lipase [Paracoccus stylophorae]|uniref:Lipase n=1 Tax=Paracoccus stylophorae TaxID=659350 RepID=A0ABY7SRL5_9RHOB|nr:SGNH/GDSL hydrolase family protein [Paracoccus stylophorae]WCR09513.1 lipase [Paracoccus stylophorae]